VLRSTRVALALLLIYAIAYIVIARRQFRLPETRYQMTADLFLVFRVPRQISGKKLFFSHQPPNQERHDENQREQSPVRSEG